MTKRQEKQKNTQNNTQKTNEQLKLRVNSGAPERLVVPVPLVTPVLLYYFIVFLVNVSSELYFVYYILGMQISIRPFACSLNQTIFDNAIREKTSQVLL